jgi:hypothetical protein
VKQKVCKKKQKKKPRQAQIKIRATSVGQIFNLSREAKDVRKKSKRKKQDRRRLKSALQA